MSVLISVFTPTYNRASLLPKLYESLKRQTLKNFEWVIVDDGSTDNTEDVVDMFISEDIIKIVYQKTKNGGKHRAINEGVRIARGKLFFIVDSDDYLIDDATTIISQYYPSIKSRNDLAGVSFRRGVSETQYIGSQKTFDDFEATALDFKYHSGIKGDLAEVFKTSILKQYSFPEIQGEKFCAEGLVWNRIALSYKFLWISKIIYIGEYLPGGLTDNSFKLRKLSPQYATLYYSELAHYPIPFLQRIKAIANYWRFCGFLEKPFKDKLSKVSSYMSILAIPLCIFLYFNDKNQKI